MKAKWLVVVLGLGVLLFGCDDVLSEGCGNGRLDEGEQCEPLMENVGSCTDFGYAGGTLRCTDQCTWDFSGCSDDATIPGDSLDPTEPEGIYDVDAGPASTCFLPGNGTAWCWGMMAGLAAPYGSDGGDPEPHLVKGDYAFPIDVCKGQEVACLADEDGAVWCWGYNDFGQLGQGTVEEQGPLRDTAQKVKNLTLGSDDGAAKRSVGCGHDHACAVASNGDLWCWGSNTNGELGKSMDEASRFPEPQFILAGVAKVAAYDTNTCAVKLDGTVWCWGSDWDGMVGQGNPFETDTMYDHPVQVFYADGSPVTGAIDVDLGYDHVCVVIEDGRVLCWGRGSSGQLGTGTEEDSSVPVEATDKDGNPYLDAIQVVCGMSQTCILKSDGTVWCWGDNTGSLLGLGYGGTVIYHPRPVVRADTGEPITGVVRIAGGEAHACAVRYDGTIWCWGSNAFGQTAYPSRDEDQDAATLVDHDWSR